MPETPVEAISGAQGTLLPKPGSSVDNGNVPPKPPLFSEILNSSQGEKPANETTPSENNPLPPSVEANSGVQREKPGYQNPAPPNKKLVNTTYASFNKALDVAMKRTPSLRNSNLKPLTPSQRNRASSFNSGTSVKNKRDERTGLSPPAKTYKPYMSRKEFNKSRKCHDDLDDEYDDECDDDDDDVVDADDMHIGDIPNLPHPSKGGRNRKGFWGNLNRSQKGILSDEAAKCFDMSTDLNHKFNSMMNETDVSMKDLLGMMCLQQKCLNVTMECCLSLDRKVGAGLVEVDGNLTTSVMTTKIKDFQQNRSDDLRESAKAIKLPNVKVPLLNSKVDRTKLNDAVKDHLNELGSLVIPGRTEVIPLRNIPKDDSGLIPVLIKFKHIESCSDFESKVRKAKLRCTPNYSQESFKLIDSIRAKVAKEQVGKQVMVRPSRNFLNLNIKVRCSSSEKWTLFTSLEIPLTQKEMKICNITDNPGWNSKFSLA